MRKVKRNFISNVIEYILLTLIVIECNTIYSQVFGIHKIIRGLLILLTILCVFFLLRKKIEFSKKFFYFFLCILFLSEILLLKAFNLTGIFVVLLLFLLLLPSFYLFFNSMSRKQIDELLSKFVNIVIVLCVISLLFYLLGDILNIIKPVSKIKMLWGKNYSLVNSYYFLHFNTQIVDWITNSTIARNTGIFTEGPMYALIILIAMCFNSLIVNNNKNNFLKFLVLFITMITTFSATGIFCSFIILLKYIIEYIISCNKTKKICFIFLIILGSIIMMPSAIKIVEKKLDTGSASHRKMDLVNGYYSFLENPILGKGINHSRPDERYPEIGYGYSNAIIPIVTDGGIVLLLLYLFPSFVLFIYSIKNKKINYLLFLVIFYILMFTTLFQYRMIIFFIIVLQYFISKKEKGDKK